MKIAVINGTEVKGCTYRIKETFLREFRENNEIVEFYLPKDFPHFCSGCKTCFFKSELLCPHAQDATRIWNGIMGADLLVFAYPVYALRAPGQVKALLDHFCCHWMVHRPEEAMFSKRAAILTQSIGAPNRSAQRDVKTSLSWLGVSSIRCLGFGLMEGVIWEELSEKRKSAIEKKTTAFARRFTDLKPAKMSVKVYLKFALCKFIHKSTLKKETVPSADNQHYIDKGWIKNPH